MEARWGSNEANGHIQLAIGVRLDEKLDELDLTGSRLTGISRIVKAMAKWFPCPEFETEDERSYLLIRLPVHEEEVNWNGLLVESSSGKTPGETTRQ